MEDETMEARVPLADEIGLLSDTIHACERLCLLSARSLLRCTVDLDGEADQEEQAPRAFVPSISRDFQGRLAWRTSTPNPHPTTSAHCVTALQSLLPVVGRFQFGTQESKGLAFHPIERDALDAFSPKSLKKDIRKAIELTLRGLEKEDVAAASREKDSSTFEAWHPFRAAQVLKALAPSHAVFQPLALRSLFAVSWYLHRRNGSLRGFPSIQATDSPGTAFLTNKCVEAIDTALSVFDRRRERFKRLIELMEELKKVVLTQDKLAALEMKGLTAEPSFHHGYRYRTSILISAVRACVSELASDSALPQAYKEWNKELVSKSVSNSDKPRHEPCVDMKQAKYEENFKTAKRFLLETIDAFRVAMGQSNQAVLTERGDTKKAAEDACAEIGRIAGVISDICGAIKPKPAGNGKEIPCKESTSFNAVKEGDLDSLPRWICSDNYWAATKRALKIGTDQTDSEQNESQRLRDSLELHWVRHRDATDNAKKTVLAFETYLKDVLKTLEKMSETTAGQDLARINEFLVCATGGPTYLAALRKQLQNDSGAGARWAEVVMNRQLAYAAAGAMAQFDPGELAHAVRVMCRDSGRVRFTLIRLALETVCTAQRADGTWNCQQPFYWKETGYALWTTSVETAAAVVSTAHMLVANPERYGASPVEVTTGLAPVYSALNHFFRWLSGNVQSFEAPPAVRDVERARLRRKRADATKPDIAKPLGQEKEPANPPLYGWCSDRLAEADRIHSWATANAIEFLVDFRRLMQERINAMLRVEFVSHHPSELKPLADVEPTDLRNVHEKDEGRPVIAQLMKQLREHKKLELVEGPWMPLPPEEAKPALWSILLYGPPGTSKSFLAKAIAGELNWPLISVSPSDFLARGDAHIEPRAQEIFSAFSAGSRVVYFFDEVDELIRGRSDEKEQRSALSFLTPSFLTKLQDFRETAEKKEFIFVLATNYKDRIDSAAIRSGRIDQHVPVVYPDAQSRGYIILRDLLERSGNKDVMVQFDELERYLTNVQTALGSVVVSSESNFLEQLATFSGFLSYQKLKALLKLMPANNFDEDEIKKREEELRVLIEHLAKIGKGVGRYQPEISLAEYARRPEAFEEFKLLKEVIPAEEFPWRAKKPADQSNVEQEPTLTQVQTKMWDEQLTDFWDHVKAAGTSSSWKKNFEDSRWDVPADLSSPPSNS